MKSIAKTTRLPARLVRAIKFRTKKEKVDESTALRQLLHLGVQEYTIKLYSEGKITLREAAELNELSVRDMLDILADHGILGNIQYDTQKKSLEIIKQFS
ncbi:UPF0175 family protein [Candidatus Woesearchaeota archaeon]|nr:UPF0175 family protein [Candidatus Woesearchaeota archaeon]